MKLVKEIWLFSLLMVIYLVYLTFLSKFNIYAFIFSYLRWKIEVSLKTVLFPLKTLSLEFFSSFDKVQYCFIWLSGLLFFWLLKVVLYCVFMVQMQAFTWPLLLWSTSPIKCREVDSVTSKGNFSPRVFNFFLQVLKNKTRKKSWANVTDHTFLLKAAAGLLRSRKELEKSAGWSEEPTEEGWDWECPHMVTVTELQLSSRDTAGH